MKEGDETKIRKPCMDRFHGTYCHNMTRFFGEKKQELSMGKIREYNKEKDAKKVKKKKQPLLLLFHCAV